MNFIGDFEETLAQEAERAGVDGVICGHIHHAAMRRIGGSNTSIPATSSKAVRRLSSAAMVLPGNPALADIVARERAAQPQDGRRAGQPPGNAHPRRHRRIGGRRLTASSVPWNQSPALTRARYRS